MFFKQFYLESLGHASYLVGDESTGEALVLDARRDVDVYLEEARRQGLRITHAIDTHGHNDYLSGLTELVSRQDVKALGYVDADLGYDHRDVRDGEFVEIGDIAFEVRHTPGHTPEHVSLVVHDRSVGDEPALMLSGGAILVGDLARPDLLGGDEQAKEMAVAFCHTIQEKILFDLPDHLEIFPTHVSGSLCGGNIGSRLSTTLGYERITNSILARVSSSEEFVDECMRLDNLPAVPPYWKRMRKQNMQGVVPLGVLKEPPALQPDTFSREVDGGAIVLDTRSAEAFGGGHIPGSLNVQLGSSFATWAGTVLPPDGRVLLVLDDPSQLWEAVWQLLRIGYDVPIGWLAGGMFAWRTAGKPVTGLRQITVHELREALADVKVLDVRQPAEWADGHIPDSQFITGAELPERIDEVPKGTEVAVVCGSGFRSSVAASLLLSRGYDNVMNVLGGMSAWNALRYPTTSD
ncbi:MAG: MBL fold metallo-hydrolase [Actinomycetota bacterium]